MLKLMGKNFFYNFTLKNFVYLNLCIKYESPHEKSQSGEHLFDYGLLFGKGKG